MAGKMKWLWCGVLRRDIRLRKAKIRQDMFDKS
jgi:hypothetical protein